MDMKRVQYSAKLFRQSLPAQKRLDDSVITRYFHRPLSFYVASACAKMHITANMVSFASIVLALLATGCFLIEHRTAYIVGAVLLNFWMVLDCVDGNLARVVKSEPYGEFLDGASGYIVASCMYICIGVAAYRNAGLLFEAHSLFVICMAAASSISEILARLLYQKFTNVDLLMQEHDTQGEKNNGVMPEGKLHKIKVNIGKIGTWIYSPFLLAMSILRWFDLFTLVGLFFNLITLAGTTLTLFAKVFRAMSRD